MAVLQNVDTGTLLLVAVGCVVLCVVGLILFFGLQLLGTTLHAFVGLVELFGNIINGGPVAWCGCLFVVFLCAGIIGGALLFTSCKTNPTAMNFCLFFR